MKITANETSFTPGPWSIDAADDVLITADIDGLMIAEGCNGDRTDREAIANARLIAAAPETLDAATGLNALIVKAQQLLARYIVPDSDISEYDVIDQLIYIFDGPEQRAAQQKWAEALAKAVQK